MRQFIIARLGMLLLLYWPFILFSLKCAVRPLSEKADWMERDTKTKAGLCALLYGLMVPTIGIVSYVGCDVLVRTPLDIPILCCDILSAMLFIAALAIQFRHLDQYRKGKILVRLGYLVPLGCAAILYSISNLNGGII